MTFISAFRCNGGVVLGADSQETYGDYKLNVEKLRPINAGEYQIAVGGCGVGDLVDSLCDHIHEWVEESDVRSERELIKLLRPKLRDFYAIEVAAYPDKKLEKRITALLCARHKDAPDLFLLELRGSTVRQCPPYSLVGWDLPILQHFVRRLYRPNMPISQAVLLTLYLFSLVSSTVTAVGGDTRIVIGNDKSGLRVHDHLYVSKIEENIRLFTSLIDKLVLSCPDTSLSATEFERTLTEFVDMARHLRQEYIFEMGHLAIQNALSNPEYAGDSYPVIPPGSSVVFRSVSRNGIIVNEPVKPKEKPED